MSPLTKGFTMSIDKQSVKINTHSTSLNFIEIGRLFIKAHPKKSIKQIFLGHINFRSMQAAKLPFKVHEVLLKMNIGYFWGVTSKKTDPGYFVINFIRNCSKTLLGIFNTATIFNWTYSARLNYQYWLLFFLTVTEQRLEIAFHDWVCWRMFDT